MILKGTDITYSYHDFFDPLEVFNGGAWNIDYNDAVTRWIRFKIEGKIKSFTFVMRTQGNYSTPKVLELLGSDDPNFADGGTVVATLLSSQLYPDAAHTMITDDHDGYMYYEVRIQMNPGEASELNNFSAEGEAGLVKTKFILKDTVTNKFFSIKGDTLFELPNSTISTIKKYGISRDTELSMDSVIANKKTITSNYIETPVTVAEPFLLKEVFTGDIEMAVHSEKNTEALVRMNVVPYSAYDLISEKPTIGIYNSTTQDVVVTTETEPFTLYDEFDDEVEVVYYTDDPEANAAKIGITHNWSPLDDLEGPKSLALLTQEEDAARDVKVTGLMKEEFVHLSFWINIENLIGIQSTTVSENAPFVIQRKSDMKHFSYHQGHFFEIPLNERMVHNYGFLPAKINAITKDEWRKFLGDEKEIRLCYLFSNQKLATKSVMKSIETTHRVGVIKVLREIRSTTPSVTRVNATVEKFSLEGRLKEIERINLNNLLALDAHTALAFNVSKMNMHEIIVETFDNSNYELPIPISEYYYETNMTSNNSPSSLKASASSIFKGMSEYDAYKAFDGDNSTTYCWISDNNAFLDSWIQLDFGESKEIDLLVLTNRNLSGNESTFVKSFAVEGSNDGIAFKEITRFMNIPLTAAGYTSKFILPESDFDIYRIKILDKQGTTLPHVSIGEIEFGSTKKFKPTAYNPATKQFEGEFTLEIPLEIPNYAESLFIQSEGSDLRISITDEINTRNISDEYTDVLDIKLFDKAKTKMIIQSNSADSFIKAIAYAWQ